MDTKKTFKVVGIDPFGSEYPITKKSFSTAPSAHKWVAENQRLVKSGFVVKTINEIVPEEAKEEASEE